jgi:hypothetical protein
MQKLERVDMVKLLARLPLDRINQQANGISSANAIGEEEAGLENIGE